jgi:hypothetical protein
MAPHRLWILACTDELSLPSFTLYFAAQRQLAKYTQHLDNLLAATPTGFTPAS